MPAAISAMPAIFDAFMRSLLKTASARESDPADRAVSDF
jgi:hypothetical protein